MLRTLTSLLSLLILALPITARAEDPPSHVTPAGDCQVYYSSLDWRLKYHSPMMNLRQKVERNFPWNLIKRGTPREEIAGLESIRARDIYPRTGVIEADGTWKLKANNEENKRFAAVFHELMTNRVRAGVLPGSIKRDFIRWLKQTDGQDYPKINLKTFYDTHVKSNRPVYEYFDERLIEFMNQRYGVSSASVPQTINSLELSALERAKWRWADRARRGVIWAGATAGTVSLGAFTLDLYNKTVKSVTDPLAQPLEKAVTNTVKSGVESIVDGARAALKWPDKSEELLAKTQAAVKYFKDADYTQADGATGLTLFDGALSGISGLLPEFREVILAKDKEFENNWLKMLTENRASLATAQQNYNDNRRNLTTLRNMFARNPTEELKNDIAFFTNEQKVTEANLLALLTPYFVLKAIRGEKNPLDKALDKDYAQAKEKYFRAINSDALRKNVAEGLELVVHKVADWHKGSATDNKVPEAAASPTPAAPAPAQPPLSR